MDGSFKRCCSFFKLTPSHFSSSFFLSFFLLSLFLPLFYVMFSLLTRRILKRCHHQVSHLLLLRHSTKRLEWGTHCHCQPSTGFQSILPTLFFYFLLSFLIQLSPVLTCHWNISWLPFFLFFPRGLRISLSLSFFPLQPTGQAVCHLFIRYDCVFFQNGMDKLYSQFIKLFGNRS